MSCRASLRIRQRTGCHVWHPSGSRMARARRAGDLPWAFTLAAYPGRTLVRDRAQMEGARVKLAGLPPPGGTARTTYSSQASPCPRPPTRSEPGRDLSHPRNDRGGSGSMAETRRWLRSDGNSSDSLAQDNAASWPWSGSGLHLVTQNPRYSHRILVRCAAVTCENYSHVMLAVEGGR